MIQPGTLRILFILALIPVRLGAQEPSEHTAAIIGAIRTDVAFQIDGRADEPAWLRSSPVTSFRQVDPVEGGMVTESTLVRLAYDAHSLYVSGVFEASGGVSTRLARRDEYLPDTDWFVISLDTHHDHRSAYRFRINPSGVKVDETVSPIGDDRSWDPVWEVGTTVSDSGWSFEMRIPFNQLRFGSHGVQTWGIQLEREIAARRERAVFAFTPKRESGGVPRYGHLEGLTGLSQGAGLEILPYVSVRGTFEPLKESSGALIPDPFRDGTDLLGGAGLDLKFRITSNLTVDATVNPDFGQVEVDPAVVNLTEYEVRFDEKRPFFVEGASIFEFGEGVELLYSRRIGEAPRWSAPGGAYHELAPAARTILGAAKFSGRPASGWSLGLLGAVTGEEFGQYVDSSGMPHRSLAAPATSYAAARLTRSTDEDRTSLGFLVTAVNRRLGRGELVSQLAASAYVAGADFRQRWANNAWTFTGHLAGSRVAGAPEAIERLQRSSARYFQRPDAVHLQLDPSANELTGYSGNLRLTRQAGLHWRGRAQMSFTSPGFEVNDAGFQQTTDRIGTHARLIYVEERPGSMLRQWSVNGGPDASWNFAGDQLGISLSAEANAQLLSYWSGEIRLDRSFAALDDRLTRGGPLARAVGSSRVFLSVDSDDRKAWSISPEADYRWSEAGGRTAELGIGLALRPSERWSLALHPSLAFEKTDAQFVGSVADSLAFATFGRRYLFADLEQVTASLVTRLNVTFRPDLSLELYAQPFIASGEFGLVKELRQPRTYSFLTYGRDIGVVEREGADFVIDPDGAGPAAPFRVEEEDFATRSVRGNAVLRWEWRPGSTIFVVWQQTRSATDAANDLDFGRQARDLFAAAPSNVVMLKATYWFSR